MNNNVSGRPVSRKLAIIAGGGNAPRVLIDACRTAGRPFFVFCLENQFEGELPESVPHTWVALGAGSKLRTVVKEQGLQEAVMIGHVRRPSLSELKPDMLALKILTKVGLNIMGDDALLQAVGKAIQEETGMHVIAPQDVFKDLLTPEGQLGRVTPDRGAEEDIARGIAIALALGRLDVGQAVIVQQGIVLGVEAAEGTDVMIARCTQLRRAGPAGVLVKIAKPQQDNRYDLPTVGPKTIEMLKKAGLRGMAVEAGRSLLLEREKTIAAADAEGLFIVGVMLE
jgi:DUF1009 family protein